MFRSAPIQREPVDRDPSITATDPFVSPRTGEWRQRKHDGDGSECKGSYWAEPGKVRRKFWSLPSRAKSGNKFFWSVTMEKGNDNYPDLIF